MAAVLLVWLMIAATVVGGVVSAQRPERAAAFLFALAAVLTPAVATDFDHRWNTAEIGPLVVDAVLVLCLLALAGRAGRRWLIWSAAVQTISTIAHVARFLDDGFDRYAYSLMAGASAPVTQVMLMWAMWHYPPERHAKTI